MWKHRWWLLLPLLGLMWWAMYWYNCKFNSYCDDCRNTKSDIANSGSATTGGKMLAGNFLFSDSNWSLNTNGDFVFKQNGNQGFIPGELSKNLDSFVSYEKANGLDKKTLSITGYYKSSENNTTSFPNLGIARAQFIKNELIKRGYPEGNILTNGKLKDDLIVYDNDSIQGAIKFDINKIGGQMSEDLLLQPRTIYFATGKNQILITDELKNYFVQAKDYLDKNPNVKLSVVGHTDNKGDSIKNNTLSMQRADFVKTQLTSKGIKGEQIITDGKGQQVPVQSNDTEQGRAANRRVEVTIQKGN